MEEQVTDSTAEWFVIVPVIYYLQHCLCMTGPRPIGREGERITQALVDTFNWESYIFKTAKPAHENLLWIEKRDLRTELQWLNSWFYYLVITGSHHVTLAGLALKRLCTIDTCLVCESLLTPKNKYKTQVLSFIQLWLGEGCNSAIVVSWHVQKVLWRGIDPRVRVDEQGMIAHTHNL